MTRVAVESSGGVRTVTLARPHRRNALDGEMLEQLAEALTAVPSAAERVCVLRAQGPAFCAGLDLKERALRGTPAGPSPIETVLRAVEQCPVPVVAAVAGPAVAGGCELAIAADLVVAVDDATFSMPLARLGTAPTWRLVEKLHRRLGPGLTRRLLLTGVPLRADLLATSGALVAVPVDAFEATLEATVAAIASAAPQAIAAVRATIARLSEQSSPDHAEIDDLIQQVRSSTEAAEGFERTSNGMG